MRVDYLYGNYKLYFEDYRGIFTLWLLCIWYTSHACVSIEHILWNYIKD